jgi:hypothetical protein
MVWVSVWAWLGALGACAGPVDVAATRVACGLGPDAVEAVGLDGDHEPSVALSGPCVEALAGDAGLVAADWGFTGAPVTSAETDLDRVLLALYFGLAADLGPASALAAPGALPSWLADAAGPHRRGLPPGAPASRALYPAVMDRIPRLMRDPGLDLAARRTAVGVTLGPATHRPLEPVELWALLAHEAAHGVVADHIPCGPADGEPACDADADGALGTAAWFGWAWRAPDHVGGALGERWAHAAERARASCERVETPGDARWCRPDG